MLSSNPVMGISGVAYWPPLLKLYNNKNICCIPESKLWYYPVLFRVFIKVLY